MSLRAVATLALLLLAAAACAGGLAPMPPAAAPPPAPPPSPHAEAQAAPPSFGGIWLGTLHAGKDLRVQIRLDLAPTPPVCLLDSLDQHAMGIPCANVVVTGSSLSVDVPAVNGKLQGTISPDGNQVTAIWTQGGSPLPLVLMRQASALEATPPPKPDPALPPVAVADLEEVLDKDLAAALARGELAPGTGTGVTIGVVQHGVRRILAYGATKADSVFEIGSITKTFTGLLLAQLVEQKKVRLDEPVRALLPAGSVTVAAPASGREITLLDLSAQRSGLPRMPDNFHPADPTNPYADYDAKALYAFVSAHGLERPEKPQFLYSNLGVGLLGQALAVRTALSYEALVHAQITGPLGMRDTAIALTPAMRSRFAVGHDGEHKPASAWDTGALAGAGGLRSTAADMLTYLEAQLHPDRLPAGARATPEGRTLTAAIAASHEVRGEAGAGMHIALGWVRVDETGSYWHNGGTGGFSSFALFNPEKDFGVVVLCNASGPDHRFADDVGTHVSQRLQGQPAVSLAPVSP